ncbi:MAG: cas8a1 [Clostridia bacterium]|nr:cas8a1 [Clostridia bacterium]
MGKKISFRLNNFLFNSGVLGFMYVLDTADIEWEENGNCLMVDTSVFDNFDSLYFNALKSKFYQDTVYYRLIEELDRLNYVDINTEDGRKAIDDLIKYSEKILERASYKSGYEIIKARGNSYDIVKNINVVKKEKDILKKKDILEEIRQYVKSNEDVLIMKDIVYTKIYPFWQSVSFLNSSNAKKEMQLCYREYFVEPVVNYVSTTPKGKIRCLECSSIMSSKDSFAMSWLNDVGVDLNRKKSYFWDFKPDTYICPVCNLIYSCVPLGFTMVGMEGIFINNNENIQTLRSINNGLTAVNFAETQHGIFSEILRGFKKDSDIEQAKKEIGNIQVVRRRSFGKDKQKYQFNILSKPQLEAIKKCKDNLDKLVRVNYKVDDNTYLNIYDEVIYRIFNNQNLYALIHEILRRAWVDNQKIYFLVNILNIQTCYFQRREEGMMNEESLEKTAFYMRKDGEALKRLLVASEENSEESANNKLRSFVYQLLNALKTKDSARFMDIVLRLYIGLGKEVPVKFQQILTDEEAFLTLGYAFIIGLKGENYEKEEIKHE